MGYEVKFKYFEKDSETGDYNKEEEKSFTKKIGKSTEEVPMEKLAFVIMNQMSRRDIWVEDVEIYEFIKKKLSFKESSSGDGIVIGGKKFGSNTNFDNISSDTSLEDEEDQPMPATETQQVQPSASPQEQMMLEMQKQIMALKQQLTTNQQQPQPHYNPNANVDLSNADQKVAEHQNRQSQAMQKDPKIHPIRYEFFKPDPEFLPSLKQKGLKFTVNGKYPIYDERLGDRGYVYVTEDDDGKRMMMHSIYFVPNAGAKDSTGAGILEVGNEYDKLSRPQLTYQDGGNAYVDPDSGAAFNMPDVRRDIRRARGF